MLSKQSSEKLTNSLYSEIPEFETFAAKCIDQEFRNNSYLTFGPFGSLLRDWIIESASPELIDKCYSFINHICSHGDKDVEQMLKVTFFEPLTDSKQSIELSKLKFRDRASILFEEVLNGVIFGGGNYAK
jgi:hypothetical protein